ncbi:MAG: glycosyl hydrolase, partial [Verrucomicrobia bacterium]|nr:glycosyl hydrolase [Verrucomicrobiota bacterium]
MKTSSKIRHAGIALLLSIAALNGAGADLEAGFARPPAATKPWCYWYWFNDNISKEGITHDLEAMARVGIGEALMANIYQPDYPAGKVKVLSEEWWGLVEHTIREGGRVGVDIGLFNCPGWSMSGGPWIKPEQSMRYLVSSELRVTGPLKFAQKLPPPKEQFQDVAVLAFPAPQADAAAFAAQSPRVTCNLLVAGVEKLADGDRETALAIPVAAKAAFAVELETTQPFTARSLAIYPGGEAFGADCVLEAADAAGQWQAVRRFKFDRSNMNQGLGPMPRGPVTISFAPVTAKKFRVTFGGIYFGRLQGSTLSKQAALTEIELSGAARVEAIVEKQLG